MRVAILADPIDNQNAGVHVFTKEMVNALIRTNPGNEIILIREKQDPELTGVIQKTVWNTRLPIGFASLRLFLIVPFILHKLKVDVVIEPAHFGPFNLSKKIKRVTIIHDLTPILFPKLHRWHSQILQKIFLRGILNKTDFIIANSDNTARDICKVYPNNCTKVKRIYPGKSAIYAPANKQGVLEKHKITGPYFLFVGTIEPRKNLPALLEAFRIFKQNNKNDYLLVIAGGKGWKSQSFFRALENHPYREQICVTGFVETDDLPTLYTQALAFIYPSLYEGFGLPIIEAMSCGTPVIAANNSSLTESGGGLTSYFEAGDPFALSEKMAAILKEKKGEMLSAKLQDFTNKFSWNEFAKQIWALIEK